MFSNLLRKNLSLIGFVILTAFVRFDGLGYSDFYGDETKVLYVDKTVSATKFFLDQRKGPVQFFVAWVVEKLSGGFSEYWIRFPFALASVASVVIFDFLIKKLFNDNIAKLATILFSLSGFSVAFGRTAQYQSFLMLLGFLGILSLTEWLEKKKAVYLLGSALSFSLAFLCHYDAIFYFLPAVFLLNFRIIKSQFKTFMLCFILPIITATGSFYLPYCLTGFFKTNTLGYISRRLVGSVDFLQNNSLYTFSVYNPFKLFGMFVVLFSVYYILSRIARKERLQRTELALLIWFLIPFVLLELVFKSPGTHILNYLTPLYVLSSLGLFQLISDVSTKKRIFGNFLKALTVGVIMFQAIYVLQTYVPRFSKGYPWESTGISKKYQLFLYGFPYNRQWSEIARVLYSQKGIRGFYTNDNAVVAKYYVNKLNFTEPGANFLPEYFVYVKYSQELMIPTPDFLAHYTQVEQITSDRSVAATIFKLVL